MDVAGLIAGCVYGEVNGTSGRHKPDIVGAMSSGLGLNDMSTPARRRGLQIKRFDL